MVCKNCGKENLDNSSFCSVCGAPLKQSKICFCCGKEVDKDYIFCPYCGTTFSEVGKEEKQCSYCGQTIQNDAVYCNFCGERLDGKNTCVGCGEIYIGNFCPKCGTPKQVRTVDNGIVKNKENNEEKKLQRRKILNNIFDKTSSSILLFGIVFALIFVFLIGFKVSLNFTIDNLDVDSLLSSYGFDDSTANVNLFYYFGDVYSDIERIIEEQGLLTIPVDYTTPVLYVNAVLGTVVSAGSILAVVVLSILACIGLVKKLCGKESKNAEKLAFGAMLSFVLGAILLYALNYIALEIRGNITESSTRESIVATLGFSSPTLAGIILTAISMGLAFICIAIKNRENYKETKNIVSSSVSLASSLFTVVVASVASSSIFALLIKESSNSIKILSGSQLFSTWWATYLQNNAEADTLSYILTLVLPFIQMIFVVLAITSLILQISSLLKNNGKNAWIVNIVMTVVSIVYLAFAVVAKENINVLVNAILGVSSSKDITIEATVTPAVVAMIFSALALVTSIAQKVITSYKPSINKESDNSVVA